MKIFVLTMLHLTVSRVYIQEQLHMYVLFTTYHNSHHHQIMIYNPPKSLSRIIHSQLKHWSLVCTWSLLSAALLTVHSDDQHAEIVDSHLYGLYTQLYGRKESNYSTLKLSVYVVGITIGWCCMSLSDSVCSSERFDPPSLWGGKADVTRQ